MISKTINFSTGPLHLPMEVRNGLAEDLLSHRSPEFHYLFDQTADLFKEKFCVKDFFLLSGTGTLANEAMVQQIKMTRKKGLILSNGEFGNRLFRQATINSLNFMSYVESTGNRFDEETIRWGINRLNLVLEDMVTNRSKIKGHFFEFMLWQYGRKYGSAGV